MFMGLDGVWIAGATSDVLSVIITLLVLIKTTKGLARSKEA